MILWIGRKFIEREQLIQKNTYLPTSNSRKIRELGVVRIVLPIHGFPIHGKFLVPKNVYWEVTLYTLCTIVSTQYIQVSFYKMNGGQVLNEFWVNFFKQGKAITALIGKLIGVISDVASVFMHRHQGHRSNSRQVVHFLLNALSLQKVLLPLYHMWLEQC